MTAMQYENAGLEALWSLIECALLSPTQQEEIRTSGGGHYRWQSGSVTVLQAGDMAEARQYAAILAAHGINVVVA